MNYSTKWNHLKEEIRRLLYDYEHAKTHTVLSGIVVYEERHKLDINIQNVSETHRMLMTS